MDVVDIFDKMPLLRFNGLWTIKLGGPKWDMPLLIVHFTQEIEDQLGKYRYLPKGRLDATMIGEQIGQSNIS